MLANTAARAEITPLVKNDFVVPGSGMRFTTACFQGPGNEWSLGPLQQQEDASANPILAHKIRSAMRHLGADRIYAPSPVQFNGKIILPERLDRILNLGHKVLLFRNKDMPADGTFLRSERDAGIFSAGGCGVIVTMLDEHLIFAHAGRDCVINRKRVLGDPTARPFESVTDSIINMFSELGYAKEDLHRMHVWPLYSIKPERFLHRFDDPTHAEYNRYVGRYLDMQKFSWGYIGTSEGVELDIPAIAQIQFMRHGVPEENIHMEHRYLSDELPTTRNGGGRYLVAVVRH